MRWFKVNLIQFFRGGRSPQLKVLHLGAIKQDLCTTTA